MKVMKRPSSADLGGSEPFLKKPATEEAYNAVELMDDLRSKKFHAMFDQLPTTVREARDEACQLKTRKSIAKAKLVDTFLSKIGDR